MFNDKYPEPDWVKENDKLKDRIKELEKVIESKDKLIHDWIGRHDKLKERLSKAVEILKSYGYGECPFGNACWGGYRCGIYEFLAGEGE